MKIKIIEQEDVFVIKVFFEGKPINRVTDSIFLSNCKGTKFPPARGTLLVIPELPVHVTTFLALHYKDYFWAIAVYNSTTKMVDIVYSTTPLYAVGETIFMEL